MPSSACRGRAERRAWRGGWEASPRAGGHGQLDGFLPERQVAARTQSLALQGPAARRTERRELRKLVRVQGKKSKINSKKKKKKVKSKSKGTHRAREK